MLAAMIPASLPAPASRAGAAHARLRAATAGLHAEVDARFAAGLDSPHQYLRYVLGMFRFAADFEHALGDGPRHSHWLAEDMAWLGLAPLPVDRAPPPVTDPAARLGWRYVMAGSSMGARSLLRDARRLGHDDGRGATFLSRHAASDEWTALRACLQAFDADDAPRMARAEAGAHSAFALVRACFARSFDHIPSAAR
jgi:heme oxygenase